jgi:hypothetical protein
MRITVRMRDPRWEARDRYAAGIVREYNDYTGEVAPRPVWCSDEQFALTTGDNNAPIRILEKSNVICAWILPSTSESISRRYVCIPGKSGKHYNVYLSDDGLQFTCDCTGFGYRRRCSHVEEVMNAA